LSFTPSPAQSTPQPTIHSVIEALKKDIPSRSNNYGAWWDSVLSVTESGGFIEICVFSREALKNLAAHYSRRGWLEGGYPVILEEDDSAALESPRTPVASQPTTHNHHP
jgi:hypothetical protein